MEVRADETVHVILEEIAKDTHRAFAISPRQGHPIHLETAAAVGETVEIVEPVGHVDVTLRVGQDGLAAGHDELEDRLLQIIAGIIIRHLDQDGTVRIRQELRVGGTLLKILDDHILRRQRSLDTPLRRNLLYERGVALPQERFVGIVNLRILMRSEDELPAALVRQPADRFQRIGLVTESVVHLRKKMVVEVAGGEADSFLVAEKAHRTSPPSSR